MAYTSQYTGMQIDSKLSASQNSSDVTTAINAAITAAKLAMFPVGSIYISINNTNPSTFIGGTWEQIEDTFLLAAGSTYTAGGTGGEATHILTEAEMPKHLHKMAFNWTSGGSASTSEGEPWAIEMSSGTGDGVGTWPYGTDSGASGFGYTGNSAAHNNMPPYLVVYVWKRTA